MGKEFIRYEAKIKNPGKQYGYLELAAKFLDNNRVVLNKNKAWDLKKVPEDFFKRYGGKIKSISKDYMFVTSNVGFILNKCSNFKCLDDKNITNGNEWQMIKLNYLGNQYKKKWSLPWDKNNMFPPYPRIQHVINLVHMLYKDWEEI